MLVSPPAGGGLAADTVTATASSPAFADPEDPGPVPDTAGRKIYRAPAYSPSGWSPSPRASPTRSAPAAAHGPYPANPAAINRITHAGENTGTTPTHVLFVEL